jgi:hypothetical protein
MYPQTAAFDNAAFNVLKYSNAAAGDLENL